jgi:DNA-binding transcriptional ArsR family regulator
VRETSQALEAPPPGLRATRWLELIADPIRLGILRSLAQVDEATTSDLAVRSQASSQTLRRHLDALVSVGVICEHPAKSDGETPGRPAARFSLSGDVRESVRAVFGPPALRPAARMPVAQPAVAPASRAAAVSSTRAMAASAPMNGAKAR